MCPTRTKRNTVLCTIINHIEKKKLSQEHSWSSFTVRNSALSSNFFSKRLGSTFFLSAILNSLTYLNFFVRIFQILTHPPSPILGQLRSLVHRRPGTAFQLEKYRNYRRIIAKIQETFLQIFKDLIIQAEIVILQEIQELQESVT